MRISNVGKAGIPAARLASGRVRFGPGVKFRRESVKVSRKGIVFRLCVGPFVGGGCLRVHILRVIITEMDIVLFLFRLC